MLRRHFLPTLAAAPAAFAQAPSSSRLKIAGVRIRQLKLIRDVGSIEPAWNPGGQMRFQVGGGSFVEVLTNEGITGIGPGMAPDLLPAVVTQLVGKDPFDIEAHSGRLRYYALGPSYRGSAGVDIALWDIIGKATGQPLYKLWGGGKDRVTAYASMILLSTPEERARLAEQLVSEGWKAIKLRLHHQNLREDVRTVELVRKAVGDRMEILTDANQAQSSGTWQPGIQWDFRRALETARELQRLRCYLLEEPLTRYAWDQLAELNRLLDLPLAGGENNPGVHEFSTMIGQGVYDVLQPECMVLGGVTALRKIGVMAEASGKQIIPHHGGGDLGTIAHLHLVASWPHAPYLELLNDPPIGSYKHRFEILDNPPVVGNDGTIAVPQKPGLGVEIKKDWIGA